MPEKKAAKPKASSPKSSKPRPPEQTFEEVKYLKRLIDEQTPIAVKMSDNQVVRGTVEYYDVSFIRVTREDGPNLFIFKHDIKYIYEIG